MDETQLISKRPCEDGATCEAPECFAPAAWVLRFAHVPTPGLDGLHLCDAHANETQARYRARGAVAS